MWKCIHRPLRENDGHFLFRNDKGRISICDWSGDNPDLSDDGPLIVGDDSQIMAHLYNSKVAYIVDVLVTRTNEMGKCWIDSPTMMALSKHITPTMSYSADFVKLQSSMERALNLGKVVA
jgi:hypothetical protein